MRKAIVSVVAAACMALSPALCSGQQSMSDDSMQASSEDSLQNSSEDSLQNSSEDSLQNSTEESSANTTEQSSANTTDNSFQYSTDETTGASSEATTAGSSDGSDQSEDASVVIMTIAGAVVAIGLTAVGITYLVRVSGARQESVLAFQDEVYAAAGTEYQRVLTAFGIGDRDLVSANDAIVAGGYVIENDQDAADYLVALVLEITGRRPLVKDKLSALTGPLLRGT